MELSAANVNVSNTFQTASITLSNNQISGSLLLGNVSITPSQINVGSSITTPTLVSVPTLVLGGAPFSGGLQSGIINYQEFTANGTWYNPYANASVNSSLTGYEQVLVMAWGGGGGGSSNNTVSFGGGGGACIIGNYTLSSLTNTVSVTVGSGGTASRTTTVAAAAGGDGTNSIFGVFNAPGGGGAALATTSGGGGGGILQRGSTANGGGPLGGVSGNPGGNSTFGGGGGCTIQSGQGGTSIFGGGGGSRGVNAIGGLSIYGGGGGAGSASGGVSGNSVFGGNGGNSTVIATAPGGGGTANQTAASDGARGEVRVWVFGTAGTTAGAPTYTLIANTTTLVEGYSSLHTISTTNVSNGTTLYYTLNNSSTAVAADFTTAVNGSVVISGGTGTFVLTAADDSDSANEAFTVDVRTGSSTGSIVASSTSASIIPKINYNYNTYNVNTSNLTTYTFTGVNIGTASSTRYVVIAVYLNTNNNADGTATVTCGGVTMTRLISGNGTTGRTHLYGGIVPTGTTATISVTSSITTNYIGAIATWSLYDLASTTPLGTANLKSGTSPVSATITTSPGAVIIAAYAQATTIGTVWSGVNKDFDEYTQGTPAFTGASAIASSNSVTVSATLGGGAGFSAQLDQLVIVSFK